MRGGTERRAMKCQKACINIAGPDGLCDYCRWLAHGPMVWLKPGRTVLGAAGDMAETYVGGRAQKCAAHPVEKPKGRTATQRNWAAFRLRGSPV